MPLLWENTQTDFFCFCEHLQLKCVWVCDRLSGRCFACESGQGRTGIIRLDVQRDGAGLNED